MKLRAIPSAAARLLCAAWRRRTSRATAISSITVAGDTVRGQWDIALRDLDFAIGLDGNGDGEITWGELRARHADIAAYALARLTVALDGTDCRPRVTEHLVDHHSDGAYAVLRFEAPCPKPGAYCSNSATACSSISIRSTRGCCGSNTRARRAPRSSVPTPRANASSSSGPSRLTQFLDYGREGVWHIWIGFDHILFLLSLLLPAVLVLARGNWRAVERFSPRSGKYSRSSPRSPSRIRSR